MIVSCLINALSRVYNGLPIGRSRASRALVALVAMVLMTAPIACSKAVKDVAATSTARNKLPTSSTPQIADSAPQPTPSQPVSRSIPSEFCSGFAAVIDTNITADERLAVLTDLVNRRTSLLEASPEPVRASIEIVIDAAAVAIGDPGSVQNVDGLTEASIRAAEAEIVAYRSDNC